MSKPYFRLRSEVERDQPRCLLRDTPEDRERLARIIDYAIFDADGRMIELSRTNADRLIAALRGGSDEA